MLPQPCVRVIILVLMQEADLLATASCSVWHTYLGLAPRQRRTGGGMPAAATSAAASTGVTVSYTRGRPHLRDLR